MRLDEGFDAAAWDPIWEDFFCDWRRLAIAENIEPPSWVIADLVLAEGFKGVLFPSVVSTGGTNLVVYPAALEKNDKVVAIDPAGDLPKDQSSWRGRSLR